MTAATTEDPVADSHTPPDEAFTREDVAGFEAEDATAGAAIGTMLSMFFIYTVIVMSIAAWWTWSSKW